MLCVSHTPSASEARAASCDRCCHRCFSALFRPLRRAFSPKRVNTGGLTGDNRAIDEDSRPR